MNRLITRALVMVAAAAVIWTLGVTDAGAASQGTGSAKLPSLARTRTLAMPGATRWIKRYNGPGNGADIANSVAVSPNGSTVFVTGDSKGAAVNDESDYLTIAYNAATGARLWTARYSGPEHINSARAVAVSPDGTTVFVTGTSDGGTGFGEDYATIAYRATDGTRLWVARFNGPAHDADFAAALSVARDGSKVFVTGSTWEDSLSSVATVAYDVTNGAQLWAKLWSPKSCCDYNGTAIVSPGGNRVFVTGHVQSQAVTAQYGTVAYNATTGARLWARRYPGLDAASIAVSPDLARLYVTGESRFNFGTVAYSTRTGARLWVRFYGGRRTTEAAASIAVSSGGTVLVTGTSYGRSAAGNDYATVAYSASGTQLWVRRYNGPGHNSDLAIAVAAPGNGRAYVTGTSRGASATRDDYATIAYNVRTGARLWVRRYNGPASGVDSGMALAARPGTVFVTGGSAGVMSGDDYATVAYAG